MLLYVYKANIFITKMAVFKLHVPHHLWQRVTVVHTSDFCLSAWVYNLYRAIRKALSNIKIMSIAS